MIYKSIIRPLLFRFDAEKIHDFTFLSLKLLSFIPFLFYFLEKHFKINKDDQDIKYIKTKKFFRKVFQD